MCTNAAHVTAIGINFVANDNARSFLPRICAGVCFCCFACNLLHKSVLRFTKYGFSGFFGNFFRRQFRMNRFMMV